jgi:hypothetical protein
VALGYALTLYFRHQTFITVFQLLGIFSLIMLGVCVWFSFRATYVHR